MGAAAAMVICDHASFEREKCAQNLFSGRQKGWINSADDAGVAGEGEVANQKKNVPQNYIK
jgi:hypothetical protein